MSIAAAPVSLPESGSMSAEALDQFSRTFGDSRQAVWIHDGAGRCVYRNAAARQSAPGNGFDAVCDILDYRNRRVGSLRTQPA